MSGSTWSPVRISRSFESMRQRCTGVCPGVGRTCTSSPARGSRAPSVSRISGSAMVRSSPHSPARKVIDPSCSAGTPQAVYWARSPATNCAMSSENCDGTGSCPPSAIHAFPPARRRAAMPRWSGWWCVTTTPVMSDAGAHLLHRWHGLVLPGGELCVSGDGGHGAFQDLVMVPMSVPAGLVPAGTALPGLVARERENLGAGAATTRWSEPEYVPRAARCGCPAASA